MDKHVKLEEDFGNTTNGESGVYNEYSQNEKELDDENVFRPQMKIDVENNRFPYCIVWTPLPLISWFIPFIGHTGICT